MKFLAVSCCVLLLCGLTGAERTLTSAADQMIRLAHTFPPTLDMIQLEAQLRSGGPMDEVATLLDKMRTNLLSDFIRDRDNESRRLKDCKDTIQEQTDLISSSKTKIAKAETDIASGRRNWQSITPSKINSMINSIAQTRDQITKAEAEIKQLAVNRDLDHARYLRDISDFNKALADISMLKKLAANSALDNRANGGKSDEASLRMTARPTPKVVAPTAHKKHYATGFIELDEIKAMSPVERHNALQNKYNAMRSSYSHNQGITSLIGVLDTVVQQSHSLDKMDKIYELLDKVRNSLMESKREATKVESKAISDWQNTQQFKRSAINDLKILWQDLYLTKSQHVQDWGRYFKAEGQGMTNKEAATLVMDRANIHLDFKKALCADQLKQYKALQASRQNQLLAIAEMFKQLQKLDWKGDVDKITKDITSKLCDHKAHVWQYLKVGNTTKQGTSYITPIAFKGVDKNQPAEICSGGFRVTWSCTNKCGGKAMPLVRRGKYKKQLIEFSKEDAEDIRWGVFQTTTTKFTDANSGAQLGHKMYGAELTTNGAATVSKVEMMMLDSCVCNGFEQFKTDHGIVGKDLKKPDIVGKDLKKPPAQPPAQPPVKSLKPS